MYEEQEVVIQERVAALEAQLEEYKRKEVAPNGRDKRNNRRNCPACPKCSKCVCGEGECKSFCAGTSFTATVSNECPNVPASSSPVLLYSLVEFVDLIPSFTLSLASVITFTLFILIVSRLVNSLGSVNRVHTIDENREKAMRDSITYFSPPPSQRPPRTNGSSPFSPGAVSTRQRSPHSPHPVQNGVGEDDNIDIYERTPTRRY